MYVIYYLCVPTSYIRVQERKKCTYKTYIYIYIYVYEERK